MQWAFQLYSARNFQPWSDVLATLADAGYASVEGFGEVYADAAGFRALLGANGLIMPSGHFAIDALESDSDGVVATARTLGMTLIVAPWLEETDRPSDAGGWQAFGQRLDAIGKRLRTEGLDFAWHNHGFEVEALADGSFPLDHILDAAPDVGWEVDVAWLARGGADPMQWIERYAKRIVAVHVKDIAPEGEALDEDGWADVGHGVLDWRSLLPIVEARTAAKHFIVEHDNPSNAERFARRSWAALAEFQGQAG